jgi:cephalosporin hydroxylase
MGAVTDPYSVREWCRGGARSIYKGIVCQQFPSDMERYRQLVTELVPPFILEVGVAQGGTALFLADTLRNVNPDGLVIGVDIVLPQVWHPQLKLVEGDSVDKDVAYDVMKLIAGRRGLVLLDGNHASTQVADELEFYPDFADYLIVEDTIMRDLPMYEDGPYAALDEWLPKHSEFVPDPDPIPTQHPGGWLRRVE